MEDKTKPHWKLLEDRERTQKQEIERVKAEADILSYLKLNTFTDFEYNPEHSTVFTIPCRSLISKKELIKLLDLTEGKLGLQIFKNHIEIYILHSKIEDADRSLAKGK